jgi:ribonuclease-3
MQSTPEHKALQKRLGHRFRNKSLLEAALTHPSFRNERTDTVDADNQRLEFLGDAVIGLLTADYLYGISYQLNEGDMTQYRSRVTSRTALAEIGVEWAIGPLLRLGRGESESGGSERESNVADAVEALIGAVYCDGGLKACRNLFKTDFASRLAEMVTETTSRIQPGNPKGSLQEFTQAQWQESPTYEIIEESGPAHDRRYVAAVMWQGEEIARGSGAGKRAAEAEAAGKALPLFQLRVARNSSTEGTSSNRNA